MKNEKLKIIENKRDAIVFLNQMLVLVDTRMMRLKTVMIDLEKALSRYDKDIKKVPTEVYNIYLERVESTSTYLLNLLGDETKTAVSYKQFRNILDKRFKNGQLDLELDVLEDDIVTLLNNFRNMRNWALHIPQSMFNSQIDYMQEVEGVYLEDVNSYFSQDEVYVLTWESHEIEWMEDLYKGSVDYYENFSKVFQRMKRDYSKLIGKSIRVIRSEQGTSRPFKFKQISKNSFAINTGKKKNCSNIKY